MPKPAAPRPHAARSDANLLVTIDERSRKHATRQISALLKRAGAQDFKFTGAPADGMLGVRLEGIEPEVCIRRLHAVLLEDPLAFRHTHRWMPVEAWSKAEMRELQRFAQHANAEIAPTESWRIQVQRHGSDLDRSLLINSLAREIQSPNVDLENAEKTVMLEVIKDKAAMAVLDDSTFLSVDEAIRKEFVEFEELG